MGCHCYSGRTKYCIARGYTGDNTCKKNEIFEKLVLQKIKRSKFSSRFLIKNRIFIFKSGK
jgi:hypothetical protein